MKLMNLLSNTKTTLAMIIVIINSSAFLSIIN